MMQRIIFNFILAVEQVNVNKLRSILTALGIVFGVGAVIAMLAIGSGARKAILDQMKLIGANNIVIESRMPGEQEEEEETSSQTSSNNDNGDNKKTFSPGLTLHDAEAIVSSIPDIELTSPEIVINTPIIYSDLMEKGRTIGVNNNFFELSGLNIGKGSFFSDYHLQQGSPVCIIGKAVETKFFKDQSGIGKKIKCGNNWLTVIGVLQNRSFDKANLASLGLRDFNTDIYVPVHTMLIRFKDRGKFVKELIGRRNRDNEPDENYHQLDKLTFRMEDSKTLQASANIMMRILDRRHNGVRDYLVEVPELLLEQEQKTQDTFNLVLAAIAGISLLVGGIGIMNIMLASVLERTKEIGIRRSLGATEKDIIQQFVFEAVFISLIGGVIGITLGVGAASLISAYADIPTIISSWSIILSFGVASSVGLVFGIVPARKAALSDPITALRN